MLTDGVLTPGQQDAWERLYRDGFESEGAFDKLLQLTGA